MIAVPTPAVFGTERRAARWNFPPITLSFGILIAIKHSAWLVTLIVTVPPRLTVVGLTRSAHGDAIAGTAFAPPTDAAAGTAVAPPTEAIAAKDVITAERFIFIVLRSAAEADR
jgi:hypothetical protein